MKTYTVLYRIESVMSPIDAPFGFICDAENTDHAEEQCINAYPDCDVMWIAKGNSYNAALNIFWIAK